MLGVVNKAIEAFVCQRYGGKLWADLLIDLSLPGYEFEAMLTYEDGITYDLIDRLAKRQSKMHQDVLEDIGGYLVAEDSQASIRRLLRFGGATFEDFLLSLDDLNDRVALALDILEMPMIRVLPLSAEKIHVRVAPNGTGSVMFWSGCCVPWRMITVRWFSWIVWPIPIRQSALR